LAWFICLAVLIDTFVVRACLVPSLMSVLGKYNWWPLSMPPVTRYSPEGCHVMPSSQRLPHRPHSDATARLNGWSEAGVQEEEEEDDALL
jgi:RND superfamily putative drug exporter